VVNGGWRRRTITEPFTDGQNDNDYDRDQPMYGSTNGEIITEFKTEEHRIGKFEGDPPILLPQEVTTVNPGGGRWGN